MSTATNPLRNEVAPIIGVGDAKGGAVEERLTAEGYVNCVTRRSADKLESLVHEIRAAARQAHDCGGDAHKEEEVVEVIDRIEREHGPIGVSVFSIGANVPCSVPERRSANTPRPGRCLLLRLPQRM